MHEDLCHYSRQRNILQFITALFAEWSASQAIHQEIPKNETDILRSQADSNLAT